MESTITAPLEKQLGMISGLTQISSSSGYGVSSITLLFSLNLDIDVAEQQVQAAINSAYTYLPQDLPTPPIYSKSNPADAPVLFVALTSPSIGLTQLNDYAENLISPSLSTLEGVAQVSIYGERRYAVRVEVDLDRLAERNLTLDELRAVLTSANANTPVGTLDGPRQTLTVQANRVSRIVFESAQGSFEAKKKDGSWTIEGRQGHARQAALPGDIENIDNWISAVTYLSAREFASEQKSSAQARTALTGATWNAQLAALSESWRCIAVDLPAHGAQRDVPFTLDAAVETVVPSG